MKLIEKPVRELPKGLPTMNDRIEYIRCVLGFAPYSFARKIGSNPQAIENVINNTQAPTMKMMNAMLLVFPIRKEWLFLGTGSIWTVKESEVRSYSSDRTGGADLDDDIVKRIKSIRAEKGLSQAIFASKLGMSRDAYAFLEINRSTLQLGALKKLILEFNVNCRWLLFGIGDRYYKTATNS